MAGVRKVGRPKGVGLGKLHTDRTRQKIQSSCLINILMSCAVGETELTSQRLKAIQILLDKSVPNLSSVEMSGPDGEEIQAKVTVEFKRPAA